VAARGEVKLAQNSAILQENVELQSLEPQMQIATNSAEWNYQTQIVTTNKPVKIVDRENQLIVIGNQGQINLSSNIAHLWQGTQGIAQKNQAQLYSQELAWNIPTETVEALGNVVYQQNNPAINLTGDRAIGKLTENNVVVSSNNTKGDRVTSIIDNP
jgi:lipopolysaccharide assembly outer membrane protein LptD (OstA)